MNISDSKKHRRFLVSLLSFFLLSSSLLPGLPGRALGAPTQPAPSSTPVALHGKLKVEKSRLTDCHGNPFQLYGMSTHGIAWFPQYISRDTFLTLRDDWNTNCIRLALYTDEYNGYCSGGDPEALKTLIKNGVNYATELGMYVIIDWHVLNDRDPNVHKTEALEFFKEMSALYKDHDNVLYEICNEPNSGTSWDSIKTYAREVIPAIRANDADAVILVGTPTWSQDIDQAAASPLEYDNLLYTLHFYANTHTDWLRQRLESCLAQGLPVFVSEFGTCDASGNGGNNFDQTSRWLELLNRHQISYCCWNLANKAETSSAIAPSCTKVSGWSPEELSETGRWIWGHFRSRDMISE
ncbi:MAG: glycoside hydrolase family 5 protein [Lachnospiraceae bacterium]|nr:glycoside hydrolase family 5 protein [Lachnospiraceae bacterium]